MREQAPAGVRSVAVTVQGTTWTGSDAADPGEGFAVDLDGLHAVRHLLTAV